MKLKLLLFTLFVCFATASFASPGVVQENWRWNNDDATGTARATDASGQAGSITITNNGVLRLRLIIRRQAAPAGGMTNTNTLRYSTVTGNAGSNWTYIDNPSNADTKAFEMAQTNANVIDGQAITSGVLTKDAAATNFINGRYILANSGINSPGVTLPAVGDYSEVEFLIKPTADALLNTRYYFSTNDGEYVATNLPTLLVGATLPVSLLSFDTKAENNGVSLKWATASQQNNDKFVVERSNNGKNWSVVSAVKGEGNSSSKNEYSVLDQNPENGVNYYQLKQYDFDGTFKLLASKSVNFTLQSPGAVVSVYPNPTFADINFSLNGYKGATVNASLINTQGQIVHKESFSSNSTNSYKLNLSTKLSLGVYILKIEGEGFSSAKNVLVN
ncbi:T9SS type A sorting domain-containing protein [Pedobacter arcticus]|uniref:T9SS type A sorting domain-containing protein n=1 Tax=Pedobacter arcticus TaxID=752140 RepID=UPI0002D5A530|nr:T9SS type A sorting domain-containing protein [Pedobacter arcticus]